MLVSSDKKIIVLLPPKTASTSIQMAMGKSGIRFDSGIKILDYPIHHLKLSELCEYHGLTDIQDYTILQFTKNPYYRFVSSYFHLMRLSHKVLTSFDSMEFKEFTNHLNKSKLSDNFIKTFFGDDSGYYENLKFKKHWSGVRMFEEQFSWNDLNAKVHYFKVEDMLTDMSPIFKLLNCNPIVLQTFNKNPKEVDYNSLLDDECMEIIHNMFINDFINFDYKKTLN
jgi:hypothetical protein